MATPYFDVDEEFWYQRAREQSGARGWASRIGGNIMRMEGRRLAEQAGFLETPIEVPQMPLRDDAQARTMRRKSAARQRKRRGRESTILTPFSIDDDGVLGA